MFGKRKNKRDREKKCKIDLREGERGWTRRRPKGLAKEIIRRDIKEGRRRKMKKRI